MGLLNIACGGRCNKDWTNVDFHADSNLPLVNLKFHICDLSAGKFIAAKMFYIENFIFRVYRRIKRVFTK